MKDYTGNQTSEDEYTVRGLVTSSAYKSNYKSYDIWLASDDGKTAQAFQLYSVAIDPSITEDYTAADALAGMYVTCTGYVKLYNSTYEMPYLGASASPTGGAYTPNVTKVEAADLSDAEKVYFEKSKLELTPTTYKKATEVELPKAKTYTDVKITWKSDSKYAKVDSGKLIITLPEDKDATANVTATLKLGTESATKKFTLTIKVASTEPAKVYTVDEILAVMKDYTDKKISEEEYTVRGLVTSSSFNSKYSSYTVWLASDDGKNAKAFELYSVGMDESIQGDYSATDALAGMMVTCTGYVELYGTTYEMPFLYADQSPSGEEYRPTITELEAPELSDAEKVAFEQGKLNLTPTTFTKAAEVTLPKAQTYTDVKITWKTSNKGYAPINNGVMTIVIPKSDRIVTITATLTLGKASATKEFKITIKAPSTEPEKVYTVDEMIALMKDYEDKQISEQEYTVRGLVTSSSFNEKHSSYTVWLASDDGKTAEAFQLYSVGMDPSITGDFTAKDALAGYTVTCKGYVELYSGEYEMPYLNANLSPTGEAYTPNIFEAVAPELSDAEKVAYEQDKLELKPLTFTEAQKVTLPVPKTYTDVQITWQTSNKGYAPIKNDVLTIILPPSDRTVTITATLTLGEATSTKKFVIIIKAKPEVETVPVLITEPVEENAYKLMVEQNNAKKTLYFAGKTAKQEYYLATTEEIEDATDVFLEKVTDGFNLYFKDENGAKKYITIEQSGDYVDAGLKDAAAGAYTFDETYLTLMTKIGEKTYYLGSYSSDLTISANDSSRLESDASNQFPARFVGYKAVDELTDAEKVWYEKNQLVVETDEAFMEATEITLPEAKKFTDVTITWKSDSTYAKVSNGKLVITLPEDKDVTATLTATLKLNTVTETKEFTLTIKAANAAHYVVATTLKVGKTYKLGVCAPDSSPVFFNGQVKDSYYLGLSEEGVDVTLEAFGDGYAFAFTNSAGKKQYIALVVSGTHVNAVMQDEAFAFTHDTTFNAFHAEAGTMGDYYIGGYQNTNRIQTSAAKYYTEASVDKTNFPCRLYELQD